MIDKGEDERVWEKVEGHKFNIEITWLRLVRQTRVSRVCDRNYSEHAIFPRVWRRSGKSNKNWSGREELQGGTNTGQWIGVLAAKRG